MNRYLILPASLLMACASVPPGEPGEVADAILADLDAGRVSEATERFEAVSSDGRFREAVYPVLYDAASRRYRESQMEQAAPLLRFLSDHYPNAVAAREALLYTLLVIRAGQDAADPQLLAEMEHLLHRIHAASMDPPVWVDLAATQLEIDRGRLRDARAAYDRFRARWDRQPAELVEYVEDLDRYLQSHDTASKMP